MWKQIILPPEQRSEMGRAVMMGLNFAVGMAVFTFLGYYIDQRRGGGSILFTVCGMVLGLAYGAYEAWMVIRILNHQARQATSRGRKGRAPDDAG